MWGNFRQIHININIIFVNNTWRFRVVFVKDKVIEKENPQSIMLFFLILNNKQSNQNQDRARATQLLGPFLPISPSYNLDLLDYLISQQKDKTRLYGPTQLYVFEIVCQSIFFSSESFFFSFLKCPKIFHFQVNRSFSKHVQ